MSHGGSEGEKMNAERCCLCDSTQEILFAHQIGEMTIRTCRQCENARYWAVMKTTLETQPTQRQIHEDQTSL